MNITSIVYFHILSDTERPNFLYFHGANRLRQIVRPGGAIILVTIVPFSEVKMIVYGDLLFAENFIIGCVLLYITGEIFGEAFGEIVQKLRLVGGGVMCGAFSMVIFLHVKSPAMMAMEACFAFVVCFSVFGSRGLWRKAVVFILVTYFMGGLAMGLLFITKNPGIYTASGIYTGDMKAGLLALFIGTGLVTAKQIIRTVTQKKFYQEHVFCVVLCIADEIFNVKGFLDTGNQLRDPINGKPAAVASESLWRDMERAGVLAPERMGVLPYGSIGGTGMMVSVRADNIIVGDKSFKGCMVAQGGSSLDVGERMAGDCQLLLSRYMADREF